MLNLVSRIQALSHAAAPVVEGFYPPDESPAYTAYGCSYHWFRDPHGRAISLDVIRSDDTGKLGLRVVRENDRGGIDGISHFMPKSEWLPFRSDGVLMARERDERPAMARSSTLVAGHYRRRAGAESKGGIEYVRFMLSLRLEEHGFGTGQLGLGISHVVATDFLRVRYRGFVEINDERLEIDSLGSISLHSGDRLPHYAYLLTVPQLGAEGAPMMLLSAVHDDSLHAFGEHLGSRSIVYAHGRHGLPSFSVHVGELEAAVPIGMHGQIEFTVLDSFLHDFLGEPTCTAAVDARYVPKSGTPIDLGRAFIDYRGALYVRDLEIP